MTAEQLGRAAAGRWETSEELNNLREALVDCLPDASPGERVLLTNSPYYWVEGEGSPGGEVVDVSGLTGPPETQTEEAHRLEVISALERHWPSSWIQEEVRPDPKASYVADAVIREPGGKVVAVVEVKTGNPNPNRVEERRQKAASEFGEAAFLLCTPNASWLFRGQGEPEKLASLPSPENLGMEITDTEAREPPQRPWEQARTVSELEELVDTLDPSQAVLDAPLLLPLADRSDLFEDLEPEGEAFRSPGPRLIEWLSRRPGMTAVSTLAPAVVASGESHRRYRSRQHASLPPSVCLELDFQPLEAVHSTFRFRLLVFQRDRDRIYFDLLTAPGDLASHQQKTWFRDVRRWVLESEVGQGFTGEVEPGEPWMAGPHSPEFEEVVARVRKLGRTESLGELCETRMGGFHPGRDADVAEEREEGPEGIPVVEGRGLDGGLLDVSRARKVVDEGVEPGEGWTREGDLLVSQINYERTAVVPLDTKERYPVQSNVVIVRPTTDEVTATYLQEYLASPTARKILEATSSRSHPQKRVLIKDLRDLPVPLVDPGLLEGMEGVRQTEDRLRSKASQIEARRRSLFEAEDGKELRSSLGDLLQTSKVISESLEDAETREFQVRNFYPYPVAYGYRLVQGLVNPASRCPEQLRVAENVLAFLGSLCLSLLREEDLAEVGSDLLARLDRGMTHKAWKDVAGACCSRLSDYNDHPLADDLVSLHISSESRGLGGVLEELVEVRNEFHHGSKPTSEEGYERLSAEIGELLGETVDRLAFLTEYPVREVTGMDRPRGARRVELTCRRHMGDHPGFGTEVVRHHRPLKKGDLFVEVEEDWWINLHPFVTMHTCPKCENREVYFLDALTEGRKTVELKSFERGHEEDSEDIASELTETLGG